MGVSSDAIVFYGYCWENEDEVNYPSYEEEDQVTEGVSWGRHCSDSCPVPFLAIGSSRVTAWRGSPRKLPSTATPLAWRDWLDRELERLDITPPEGENQPGWWVASWMG